MELDAHLSYAEIRAAIELYISEKKELDVVKGAVPQFLNNGGHTAYPRTCTIRVKQRLVEDPEDDF